MKVKSTITAAALALSLVAGTALAATTDTETTMPGNGPGYGMMNGQGSYQGMSGAGWHGKGMWGGSQDCSKGMSSQGMGRHGMMGMMGGGAGMQRGAMMNPEIKEKLNTFLDSTKDLRKSIMEKRFAYMEAQRNPDLTVGELQKQEKELFELRQQVMEKRQAFFQEVSSK